MEPEQVTTDDESADRLVVDPMIRIQILETTVGRNAIAIAQRNATIEQLLAERQQLIDAASVLQERLDEATENTDTEPSDG